MLDPERILARIDTLNGYLRELREILPESFEDYQTIEKRRACERLLQICIESVIDICALIVAGLQLGLPAEEDDLFEKLEKARLISLSRKESLKKMKGFRNILVHAYGRIDDLMVYEILQSQLGDFEEFRQEILQAIQDRGEQGSRRSE